MNLVFYNLKLHGFNIPPIFPIKYALLFPALMLVFFSICAPLGAGGNKEAEIPLPTELPTPAAAEPDRPQGTSIVEEIRGLTETATPSSLIQSLNLIRAQNVGSSEFGRAMNGVNGTLLRTLYPSTIVQIPVQDLPQNHSYARILRDVERGVYSTFTGSRDFLEMVLPFLAYYNAQGARAPTQDELLAVLPDLARASGMNPTSVLPSYFIGVVYERTGMLDQAVAQYTRAWQLGYECYPAVLAIARIMELQGEPDQAMQMLSELAIRFPDNIEVKRQLAIIYYKNGDWSRAEPAIAEILQRDSRDGEFILMRAHMLVEQGQYVQAQAPLDTYASIDPNNRLYLFLRARVQFEGFRNRDAALNYLRSIMRNTGNTDEEAAVYAVRLLMESSREADQAEGRELLSRLLESPSPPLTVAALALQDAMRQQNWTQARTFLIRLLAERRSSQDLLDAYTVEKEQGNNAAALSYARELYEREPSFEEGIIAYITALIDTGRRDEAARLIDNRLSASQAGASRSRYYYLRSKTRGNEEDSLADLRSSLFEDPRNLNALIAMFEIYHRRRDERRAVYYLKQALALSPNNPQLKRYEEEYAPLL